MGAHSQSMINRIHLCFLPVTRVHNDNSLSLASGFDCGNVR